MGGGRSGVGEVGGGMGIDGKLVSRRWKKSISHHIKSNQIIPLHPVFHFSAFHPKQNKLFCL